MRFSGAVETTLVPVKVVAPDRDGVFLFIEKNGHESTNKSA